MAFNYTIQSSDVGKTDTRGRRITNADIGRRANRGGGVTGPAFLSLEAKKKCVRTPSIKTVAEWLQRVSINSPGMEDEGCDVRLQVYEDSSFQLHSGDSSYDQDHRGYWGAGYVPGGKITLKLASEIAKGMIDEVLESCATSQ
jgi:hypothetical protein